MNKRSESYNFILERDLIYSRKGIELKRKDLSMKKIIFSIMTTAIFGVVSANYGRAAPAVRDIDSVKAALASVNKMYGEAYRKGDSSLFLDCYTPDGSVMAANAPILGGRKGLLLF